MPTFPIARASVNAGAPQTGYVTVANGDTVQLSLADTGGLSTFLWEIISHPFSGFACPPGWTPQAGNAYVYEAGGATPPSFAYPAASFWGSIGFRVTAAGDDVKTDESLMIGKDSTNGVKDIAPLEAYQRNAYAGWGEALSRNLRLLDAAVGGGGGSATPRAILWDPDNATPDAAKGEAQTWAQVIALVAAQSAPADIYVASVSPTLPYTVTGATSALDGTIKRMPSHGFYTGLDPLPPWDLPVIEVPDGARLVDCHIAGVELRLTNNTAGTASRAWENASGTYRITDSARVKNMGSNRGILVVDRARVFFLIRGIEAGFIASGGGSPYEAIGMVGVLNFVFIDEEGGGGIHATNVIRSSDASAALGVLHDGAFRGFEHNQANFIGTFGISAKGMDGGHGQSSNVPTNALKAVQHGCRYTNTETGHNLTYDATHQCWLIDDEWHGWVEHHASSSGAGDYTTGATIRVNRRMRLVGYRVRLAKATAPTIKFSLRRDSGSVVLHTETATMAADAGGLITQTLWVAAPYDLVSADLNTDLLVCIRDTDATTYYPSTEAAWVAAGDEPVSRSTRLVDGQKYVAGDGHPTTTHGYITTVEPILTEAT